MNFYILASVAALSAGLFSSAFAQSEPALAAPSVAAGEDSRQLEDIEVVGARKARQRAQAFVAEVGAAPGLARLARWDRSLCVGVAGMERDKAQYLIDRVSRIGGSLGLRLESPGCRANVMVVATTTGKVLATNMVQSDPDGFQPAFGNSDMGVEALARFQSSDAPVRWWHVSLPVSADTGALAIRMKGDDEPPTISSTNASRLRAATRDDLARAYIIVDTTQLGSVTFDALCDYIAMIALAQISDQAAPDGFDTVLNLFRGGAPDAGLTSWDLDYLRALYRADRSLGSAEAQALDIAHHLSSPAASNR